MKNRRNRQNIIMSVLCILLFFALGALLLWSRREDAKEAQRLQQIASGQETDETETGGEDSPSDKNEKDGKSESSGSANTGSHIRVGGGTDDMSETESEDEKPQAEGHRLLGG